MTDFLLLAKEEVREAWQEIRHGWCEEFPMYEKACEPIGEVTHPHPTFCRLCKRLTEFASQGDPKGKGGEDE